MKKRKDMKKSAKQVLKKHYWLLLVVCLVGTVFGTEFSNIGIVRYQNQARSTAAALWALRVYIQQVYIVITRRLFLEARTYETVRLHEFLFLMHIRRWSKTAWNMLVLAIFQFLWSLTIIGGFIKHYSYFMVPYILAENPDLGSREAVNLSRRMMNGHKWECFKLELSFLPWSMFGTITWGVLDICFTNLYKTAVFSEYYANVRSLARENEIQGIQELNDRYLFEKAQQDELDTAYADILVQAYEQAQAEKAKMLKWREGRTWKPSAMPEIIR